MKLADLKEGDHFRFTYETKERYLSQKGKTEGYCPIVGDYGSSISGEEVYLLGAEVVLLFKFKIGDKVAYKTGDFAHAFAGFIIEKQKSHGYRNSYFCRALTKKGLPNKKLNPFWFDEENLNTPPNE